MKYFEFTGPLAVSAALITGIFMGLYYDVFRFLRRIFRFDGFSVMMQDLFFWSSSAIAVFFICIKFNNGFIRIYFMLLVFMGWFIYFKTVGRIMFWCFDKIISKLALISNKVKALIMKMFRKIYIKL